MINYLPIPEDGSPKAPGYCVKWDHKWSMWNRDGEYHDVRTCLRCRRREIKDLITDKVTTVY